MNEDERRRAVLGLLESSRLSKGEVDELVDQAEDPDYWRQLCPGLAIDASTSTEGFEVASLSEEQVATRADQIRREGYFQTEPLLDAGLVARMRDAVEALRAARWPMVFAYVYDDFWQIARTASLKRLVMAVLGEEYRQNSYFWTYYVAPVRGAAGWPPHEDSPDRGSSRLTIWIPLSDATVDNGCIYVIPRDRIPDVLPEAFAEITSVTHSQLRALLHGVQAVPAAAGSLLGWDHHLIHWGSVSRGQTTARMSVMIEFVANSRVARPEELPLWSPDVLPPFSERTRTIGHRLLADTRYEPTLARYQELGRRLSAPQTD